MALCLCGCGLETKLSMVTNKTHGTVKGNPNKYIKGHNRPWAGLKRGPFSDETKQKQSVAHKGMTYKTTAAGRQQSLENIKKAHTKESREKIRLALTGRKLTPEHIRNSMRRRPITSLELAFQKIIDENGLPYKFVGNGAFIIDGLNPDFINTNGEKIAIEVYARMYKEIGERTVEKYKKNRIKRLSPYGWKIYFFDETQVNKKFVLNTLKGGGSHCCIRNIRFC